MTKQELITTLKEAMQQATVHQLFEFNDGFTRAQAKSMLNPYLKQKEDNKDIQSFLVICDESNNTEEVIKRNEFVADIYMKFPDDDQFTVLNAVASRTGIVFEEIVGSLTR